MKHEHEVQLTVPESVKEKITRATQHLQHNRTTYLVGVGCFTTGYFLRKSQSVSPVFNNTVSVILSPTERPCDES